ncbi:MAG: pseudouridine synthase [Turneriella sp.]
MASYTLKTGNELKDQRLDKVVHALLNEKVPGGISKSMARKLVMVGAAYLNGSRCRIASKPVFKGSEVRVEYNPEKLRPIQLEFPSLTQKDILFNEGGLIVVNKPANMPTVATLDNARDNLVAALKTLLGRLKDQPVSRPLDPTAVDGRPDAPHGHGGPESAARTTRSSSPTVYIGIHHRLDAPTSGCILFTLDEKMNPFVAELFRESLIQKEYLAVCKVINPPPAQEWEIKNQLERAEKKRNIYRSTKGEGDFAYSRFELLQTRGDLALIKAMPITGRTHQLRVHLSERACRLWGIRRTGSTRGAHRCELARMASGRTRERRWCA